MCHKHIQILTLVKWMTIFFYIVVVAVSAVQLNLTPFLLGMSHAFNNPIPPLVSVRLRNLSDIILEQICDLLETDIPDREEPTQIGNFLIAVADWAAIFVEHIYYRVQVKKNDELEQLERERIEMEKNSAPMKSETMTPNLDTEGDELGGMEEALKIDEDLE